METNYRIALFVDLGRRLNQQLRDGTLSPIMQLAAGENSWFTTQSVTQAITAITTDLLTPEVLERWLTRYPFPENFQPKNIGVILPGNLPLVGFFDVLCVALCGHYGRVKPSSKDRILVEYVIEQLRLLDPELCLDYLDETTPLDALIATGGDPARRYFENRYADLPSLIRGNRYSVAVLTGAETPEQLQGLTADVFQYFGLGCRNVSRIFVPRGCVLQRLVEVFSSSVIVHPGYLNNYKQVRAVRTIQKDPFLDGGFFLLSERNENSNYLSEITYTYYDSLSEVERWIEQHDTQVQCIVSSESRHPRRVDFGRAQHPAPMEYPDGVDVMAFLQRCGSL